MKRDEPIFEISTDKVDAEIPAPTAGVLAEILVTEGQTVAVQTVVARLETDVNAADRPRPAAAAPAPAAAAAPRRQPRRRSGRSVCAIRPPRPRQPAPSHGNGELARGSAAHQVVAARPTHGRGARRRDQRAERLRHRRPRHEEGPRRLPRVGREGAAGRAPGAPAAPAAVGTRAAARAVGGRPRRADVEDARADQRAHGRVEAHVGARELDLRGRLHAHRADSRRSIARSSSARRARSSRTCRSSSRRSWTGSRRIPC